MPFTPYVPKRPPPGPSSWVTRWVVLGALCLLLCWLAWVVPPRVAPGLTMRLSPFSDQVLTAVKHSRPPPGTSGGVLMVAAMLEERLGPVLHRVQTGDKGLVQAAGAWARHADQRDVDVGIFILGLAATATDDSAVADLALTAAEDLLARDSAAMRWRGAALSAAFANTAPDRVRPLVLAAMAKETDAEVRNGLILALLPTVTNQWSGDIAPIVRLLDDGDAVAPLTIATGFADEWSMSAFLMDREPTGRCAASALRQIGSDDAIAALNDAADRHAGDAPAFADWCRSMAEAAAGTDADTDGGGEAMDGGDAPAAEPFDLDAPPTPP